MTKPLPEETTTKQKEQNYEYYKSRVVFSVPLSDTASFLSTTKWLFFQQIKNSVVGMNTCENVREALFFSFFFFFFKGEVRRKINITYVLGFVVLSDVAKVFPVSSTSFARKTTGKNRFRSHSGAWRGLKTKWDLKLSLPSPTYLHVAHPILVYLSRNNNSQAQARRFPALTAPAPKFPVIFGSKWDPLTSAWRQGGASPERLVELPTDVSPLQKRIWKWDFYHCSSCNFFFYICFCYLWCELPL